MTGQKHIFKTYQPCKRFCVIIYCIVYLIENKIIPRINTWLTVETLKVFLFDPRHTVSC